MAGKVMAFGTFDGLHDGHRYYFSQARKYGPFLVVVVARDKTVEQVKGKPPDKGEGQRLKDVSEEEIVDEAVFGHHGDKFRIIEEHMPKVICLGHDQKAFADTLPDELKKRKLKSLIVRIGPYKRETLHSTKK